MLLLFAAWPLFGQSNASGATNWPASIGSHAPPGEREAQARLLAVRSEAIRSNCIQNRRYVCGRILEILPEGMVVDSGYSDLLKPPLNKSWLVPGTAVVKRAPHLVESKEPDSVCVGLVFVTDTPKSRRVKPKQFDYLVAHAYPAGSFTFTSVGQIRRTLRRYSLGLETAVRLTLQSQPKPSPAPVAEGK